MSEYSTSRPAVEARERLRSLERFFQTDPGNARLFTEGAALALQLKDYDTLLRMADARLQVLPADVPASSARTKVLIARGEYRLAAADLERLGAAAPEGSAIQQDLGLCYFCLGDFERAKAPLEAALHSGERTGGLLRLLVSTYHHLNVRAEAEALAAANAAPAEADAGLAGVYALLYLDLGRAAEAGRWARQALVLDPSSVDALTVEGTLSTANGALDAATESFERVLERAPDSGRAWIGLGSVSLLRRDLPGALERVRRGVELMETHVGSWHVLGWTYLLSGDLSGAEAAFQRALELNRNFSETHGSLAAIAALRGDTVTAQRYMEVAQRLDPMCLSAQFTRSVLAGRGGDDEKARRIVLKALSRLAISPGMAAAAGLAPDDRTRH
jgi:tetratricopeptide (TPR) repeat protein